MTKKYGGSFAGCSPKSRMAPLLIIYSHRLRPLPLDTALCLLPTMKIWLDQVNGLIGSNVLLCIRLISLIKGACGC